MSELSLTTEQRHQLEDMAVNLPEALLRRVKVILCYDDGLLTHQAAAQAGLSRSRTRYWKQQFLTKGMDIFPAIPESPIVSQQEAGEHVESAPEPPVVEESLQADAEQEKARPRRKDRKKRKIEPEQESISALPFPEPMESPGMLPDDTLAEAGRKIFKYHFAEMLRNEEGTRSGENIEFLHDMRVATRRMRVAFDIFGDSYTPRLVKAHLKGLRTIGRSLGQVRDLDVFWEKTHGYYNTLPVELRAGLDALIGVWQARLADARQQLVVHLDSPEYQHTKQQFNYFVQTPVWGVKPQSGNALQPVRVCEIAPALIYSRLASVRAFETILDNATIIQLHALRIEFKKLRYTLEFFREVLGGDVKTVINAIKGLQDHLGDLHDADVACQIINDFVVTWDAQQSSLPLAERQNPEPIIEYLAYRYAERHHLLVSFPEVWARFNDPAIRQELASAISIL